MQFETIILNQLRKYIEYKNYFKLFLLNTFNCPKYLILIDI